MRTFICAAILGGAATVAEAAPHQVNVDQLRQAIQSRLSAHEADESLARYLGDLELTEQLTQSSRAAILSNNQLGPKATVELELLGDASAFLEPPASEAPVHSVPAPASQQAMLNSAVQYVAETVKGLPNFLATRETRSFENTPLNATHSGWAPSSTELHLAGTFEQEVTYRDGREDALHSKTTSGSNTSQGTSPPGLTSTGEFGPILVTVLRDVSKGKITWDRWATANHGPAGVFRFEVPAESSHYAVNFCCVRSSADPSGYGLRESSMQDSGNAYHGTPAYHGTLMIDPANGAILRITVDPDLKADGPISRSAVAVEYGPAQIGGVTCNCPLRSIALSQARTQLGGDMSDRTVLRINEVTFTDYHRFGSASRIVSSDSGH